MGLHLVYHYSFYNVFFRKCRTFFLQILTNFISPKTENSVAFLRFTASCMSNVAVDSVSGCLVSPRSLPHALGGGHIQVDWQPDSHNRWKSNQSNLVFFCTRKRVTMVCCSWLKATAFETVWKVFLKFIAYHGCEKTSKPITAVRVWALAGDIVLCSWARHFNLAVPLSTQV